MIGCTAPSHIYPSLGLIAELVRRGHRVTYAVGASMRDAVEPAGVQVISYDSILPRGEEDWPEDPASAMRVFLDEALRSFPILTDFYDANRPDLLLYDIGGLAAPVLGRRYDVAAVQLSPTYVAWDGYEDDMGEVLTSIRQSPSGVDYRDTYATWLQDNGIDADPWDWISHPSDVLSLIPKAMQPNADRVPASVQFVGPCLDPARLADRCWAPPANDKVLLVSFGTGFNERPDFYRKCIDAFRDSDWHVVMSIGYRVDAASLGDVPSNIEVHQQVPQLAVLAAASAFVTHAGMGGCTEALWFGVPTVAIPQAVDQFGNAAMLEELGVGVQLADSDATAEILRNAVDTVADSPEIAARLAEISADIRAHGGIEKAADAVEASLRAR
ncbi:glycosyltransferase, MGT family [Rhodococcoides kyotonense]|uniref:Glycosyltransferase, MGT family n=2 Tax=Rhodococcoides kyotonense TaxID=398843 RepID=A0A239KJY3_9NOCA|nr:glycosyltransferase, MGT family [Rhodococcus kyotonensis]